MSSSIKYVRTSYKSKARFRNDKLIPPEYYKALSSVKYFLKNGKDIETAFDIVSSKRNLEKAKLSYYFYSNHSVNDIKRLQGLPVLPIKKVKKKKQNNAHKQYWANKKRLLNK